MKTTTKIITMLVALMLLSVQNVNAQAPLLPYEWKDFNSGIVFVINPTNSGLTSTQVGNAIFSAMQSWDVQTLYYNLFSGYSTSYSQGYAQDGVNSIVWQPMGITGASAITQVYKNTGTGKIIEADIKFNSDLVWKVGSGIGYDVQGVATHEIGHAIGLGEDTNCPLCSMFFLGIDGSWARTLETGDINAIKTQYCSGDVNGDRLVNFDDFSLFGAAYPSSYGQSNYNKNADMNGDGNVNFDDFSLFGGFYGNIC